MASTSMSPIQISSNCKQVTVNIAINPIQYPGPYTLTITHANGTSSPMTFTDSAILVTDNLETSGVVVATVTNSSGTIHTEATVATCQIDCCIAKLVESAITCTCKCDKCKEELDRAEKIFLLLQAAVYAAEVDGNIKDAEEKYAKASELCTEVCACGC